MSLRRRATRRRLEVGKLVDKVQMHFFLRISVFGSIPYYSETTTDTGILVWDNYTFLGSTAISSPSTWQIHRGSQTTSVIEGLSQSAPVDKEKLNYCANSSTANFDFEASYQFEDFWDIVEYSQSSWVPTSSGQSSATVETPASINSTNATTTVCSSGHSSTVPSITSKRQHSTGHYDEDSGRRKRRSDNITNGIDQEQSKFACPFRKHDPARYGIQRGWRICALSRWESIARVKFVF